MPDEGRHPSKLYSIRLRISWIKVLPTVFGDGHLVHGKTWTLQLFTRRVVAPQKSASSLKVLSVAPDITPILWYSPTRFSKKLVFPSREMFSMKSKGFSAR